MYGKVSIGWVILSFLVPIAGVIKGNSENKRGNESVGQVYIMVALSSFVISMILRQFI